MINCFDFYKHNLYYFFVSEKLNFYSEILS